MFCPYCLHHWCNMSKGNTAYQLEIWFRSRSKTVQSTSWQRLQEGNQASSHHVRISVAVLYISQGSIPHVHLKLEHHAIQDQATRRGSRKLFTMKAINCLGIWKSFIIRCSPSQRLTIVSYWNGANNFDVSFHQGTVKENLPALFDTQTDMKQFLV